MCFPFHQWSVWTDVAYQPHGAILIQKRSCVVCGKAQLANVQGNLVKPVKLTVG